MYNNEIVKVFINLQKKGVEIYLSNQGFNTLMELMEEEFKDRPAEEETEERVG